MSAVDEPVQDLSPLILIVDDDEISLGLITLFLQAEGCRVVQASGGNEAIRVIADCGEDKPSIVLADLQMPGLCGRELAFALRTLLPRSLLAAMSATPSHVEGYDRFLGKPLDVEALRTFLSSRQLNNLPAPVDIYADETIPVLDERVFLKLQGMMSPQSLAEVYGICLRDSRQRALKMQELSIGDEAEFAEMRRSAHAIKGGAGMIGASSLAAAAAQLELGSYRKDDLQELVNKLLFSCDELQRILLTKSKPAV